MRSRGVRTWMAVFAAVIVALALGPALVATGEAERGPGRHPHPLPAPRRPLPRPPGRRLPAAANVAVAVRPGLVQARLPPSFLGLSIEYWDLARLDRDPALLTRVFDLLHVPGDSPGVLRVGGDSADHTYWRERARASDFHVFRFAGRTFALLRRLTVRAHLKLLLDLNLAARDPLMAASFARRAVAELPRGTVEAFEVGNEPDVYHREAFYRLAAVADVRIGTAAAWGHYSAARYADEFRAYAAAVTSGGGGIRLAGPEVANPRLDLRWLTGLLATDRPVVGILTAHRYPLSACMPAGTPLYPTLARVLSPEAARGLGYSVAPAVALARRAGLPFRLTELNSVTCGGRPGVSNTFATALWAPDALLALLRAHVDGVNIHVRANKVNGAFTVAGGRLVARPLLYGLLAFVRTVGAGGELLGTRLHSSRRVNVAVWAINTRRRLKLLALDKGRGPIRLILRVPVTGPGTVERLSAPGVRATAGVTLAGQHLGPQGQWLGPLRRTRIVPVRGGYRLTLAPYSGALISLAR